MAKTFRFKDSAEQAKFESLWSLVFQGMVRLNETAMMYFATKTKKRIFTTRGRHAAQVAEIAREMVARLGGDEKAAKLMGMGHDLGHTPGGHDGEAALGRVMLSPDEFKEWKLLKDRDGFDHAKHSKKKLIKMCHSAGVELSDYIANGIEAHSTGSGVTKSAIKQMSLEAECVMRADKIASSVSDTQDMIKSGALKIDSYSLKQSLNSPEVRELVEIRVFKDLKTFQEKEDKCAIDLFGGRDAYLAKKQAIKEDYMATYQDLSGDEIEALVEQKIEKLIIDEYLKNVAAFIQNSPGAQVNKMISRIVEATKAEHETLKVCYQGETYTPQLVVPKDIEAILAALRGLLQAKELERGLGKAGPEVGGLIEVITRYVYQHQADFENNKHFQYWKTDENGNPHSWKETAVYSIGEFSDIEFKEFAIELLQKEDAREVMAHCKYRDPRDKRPGTEREEYCEADFSTPEAIEKGFIVDVNRTYQPSAEERRNFEPMMP